MKTIVFALLVLAVACSADDKIIGGYECSPNSQPWQIYLTYDNGQRWCGASLINDRWAVSAAHCYLVANRLTIHLGEHNIAVEEGTEQRIKAEKVIPHPKYNDYTLDNDFMLIKLKEPAVFNQYVQPIPLTTSCSSEGEQCLVSGWGNQINTGVDYADVLQCLNLPVLTRAQCEGAYGWQITKNMFCAGFMEGGKDACQGDSGGPVICNGELRGVVSWGYGCADSGYPGVYTEVCRYTDWVASTIFIFSTAMKTVVFALLVVTVACSPVDKIIGGYDCPQNSQPWQIYLTNDGQRWCGASLINDNWAVSAAHCNITANLLTVYLGKHNIDVVDKTEQQIKTEKVFPHPEFKLPSLDNDIMLIKLKEPAVFTLYVQPIPLTTSCSSEGEQCLVSGWGYTEVGLPSALQCLDLAVQSRQECERVYKNEFTQNMLCAGFMEGGKGVCHGDSGGPLVCNGELRGVVSWGAGCAEPGYPAVYVEVCRYTDWIATTIANN
ncbi:snake venom serine protease NaSP-like [Danio aesculapii]|uniref:snake venom serine protease NaSP-like n=1 Tax=Danio aesculapii TaxID=1142201 RepID=UPI0024C06BE9|nr:snake venom serine protease NaSP-like [Danio aesculapii]